MEVAESFKTMKFSCVGNMNYTILWCERIIRKEKYEGIGKS